MMRRTVLDAAADAAFEARLARKFAKVAARAEDDEDTETARTLRDASRVVRVRSLQHRAEAHVLMMHDWERSDDDEQH